MELKIRVVFGIVVLKKYISFLNTSFLILTYAVQVLVLLVKVYELLLLALSFFLVIIKT